MIALLCKCNLRNKVRHCHFLAATPKHSNYPCFPPKIHLPALTEELQHHQQLGSASENCLSLGWWWKERCSCGNPMVRAFWGRGCVCSAQDGGRDEMRRQQHEECSQFNRHISHCHSIFARAQFPV